ncbi:MAG: hypothetical protein AB7I18_00960 [Candidatus Berkiella sp.]
MALARLAPNLTTLQINGMGPVESFEPYTLNTLASLGFTAKDLSTLVTLPRFVPNLQEMDIRFDKNARYDPITIATIDSLKKITLSGEAWGNTVFHINLIQHLMELAPNLENIKLNYAGFEQDGVFSFFQNLRVINSDYKSMTNQTLGDILDYVPKLESLVISDSISSISQVFLKESRRIPERLALKKLSLIQPHSQSASFLATIVQRSPDLEELNLTSFRGCAQFFKKLVESGTQLPHLKKINFANTNLAYKDLLLLKQIAPNLTTIDISETPASTHEELKKPGNEIVVNYEIINNTPYGGYVLSSRAEDDHNTLDMDLDENEEDRRLQARASNQAQETGSEPSNQRSRTKRQNNTQEKSTKVNTDTSLDEVKYELTQVFKSTINDIFTPPPGQYRIDVFNEAAVNDPFDLNTTGDMQLEPYQDYHYGGAAVEKESSRLNLNVFIGKHAMLLTNEFKALPSLNANEFIKSLNVSGLAENDVEIQYSKRDNLYYIRKKSPGQFNATVDFSIEIQHRSYDENLELEEFIQYFKGFGAGALDLKGQNNWSPEALAEEMFKQRLGRCDQRAVVFKYMAQKKFPDWQVRIISNDCHSYVEVKQGGFWIKHDLGGYPAKTDIKKVEDIPKAEEALSATTISRSRTTIEEIDPRYVTWDTTEVIDPTPNGIAMRALAATSIDSATGVRQGQNVLLQCENNEDIAAMNCHIQYLAKHTHRPVFVINNPEQIACASTWLRREKDNTGTTMKIPGGPLHDFLTKEYQVNEQPILIVNWDNFSADQLVRFNSLIDKERLADGTAVPANMIVVGLYNSKKPDAYTGSDFHSRNPVKLKVPKGVAEQLTQYNTSVAEKKCRANDADIELYHSYQWKEILLGHWTIEKGVIRFIEGELVTALKQGKNVHLRNAPWHLPSFVQFMQEMKIHGVIHAAGETVAVPASFWDNVSQSEGYDWQVLVGDLLFESDPKQLEAPLILNAGTFTQFIPHYDIRNSLPEAALSLFAQHQNKSIQLLVTSHLTEQSWHQLLKEAKRWNVKLKIGVAANLKIPDSLAKSAKVTYLQQPKASIDQVSLIASSDVGFTVESLKYIDASTKPVVIDISELDHTDVFYHVDAKVTDHGLSFHERFSQVWELLQAGQTVILKGHFKEELINACLPLCTQGGLMINGKMEPFKGKLILVSDEPLTKAIGCNTDNPSLQQKLTWIFASSQDMTPQLKEAILAYKWPANISLAQLQAAVGHYKLHQNFDFHEGILSLTAQTVTNNEIILDDTTVKAKSDQFVKARLQAVSAILKVAPFAFIGGKTGVGKSTFMQRYFKPENGFKLFNELTDIEAWAQDRTPGLIKTLFFDEANISDKDYTMFEGLYEIPPFIVYQGKIIELTPEHKVVLAGNPMSYGGERHLPTLLAAHGNACTFDVIPNEYLYQEILKPVFDAKGTAQHQTLQYSRAILESYQQICSLADDTVLISPRELKMMAQMIVNAQNKEQEFTHIIYSVAIQCLPPDKKNAFIHWFQMNYPMQYLPSQNEASTSAIANGKQFILTPSRVPIYQSLQRLLSVRQHAIVSPHKVLQSPGLGGLLLEGEPGTGKSHFIYDALLKEGYQQIPIEQAGTLQEIPTKGFYVIPASLSFKKKREVLLAAFNEGLPVVIDEINSGPMMEQLLNSLLMGEHPETKQGPNNPGFLLLGTQNPFYMAGRQATSLAIARRVLFHEFKAYTRDEMKMILTAVFPNVSTKIIENEIAAHQQAVSFAKANFKEPSPVFRDLYHMIEIHAKTSPVLMKTIADLAKRTHSKRRAPLSPLQSLNKRKPISEVHLRKALADIMTTLQKVASNDPKLLEIELNRIEEAELKMLTNALQQNTTLKEISVTCGSCSKETIKGLSDLCDKKGIALVLGPQGPRSRFP